MKIGRVETRDLLSFAPAIAVGVLYEVYLGHRHDYTGHFAAGYGGTFGAAMVWLRILEPFRFSRWSTLTIGPLCLACILLGAFLEATAFNIAKFDEIDFCNQSLGAVLASIAAAAYTGITKPPDKAFDKGVITGVIFVGVGCCFVVA